MDAAGQGDGDGGMPGLPYVPSDASDSDAELGLELAEPMEKDPQERCRASERASEGGKDRDGQRDREVRERERIGVEWGGGGGRR